MDEIFTDRRYQPVIKNIFVNYLDHEDLLRCQLINQNCKIVLDSPFFWLKKLALRGLSKEDEKNWIKAIQMTEKIAIRASENITIYLRNMCKRKTYVDIPCFIVEDSVKKFSEDTPPALQWIRREAYHCGKCGKSFTSATSLETHSKNVHDVIEKKKLTQTYLGIDQEDQETDNEYKQKLDKLHRFYQKALFERDWGLIQLMAASINDPRKIWFIDQLNFTLTLVDNLIMNYDYPQEMANLFKVLAPLSSSQKLTDPVHILIYDPACDIYDSFQSRNIMQMAVYRRDNIEVVKTLVSLMKNPNFALRICETPLYPAVRSGHVEIVKILVSVTEDPNVECQKDCPVAYHSRCYNHDDSPIIVAAKMCIWYAQFSQNLFRTERLQNWKEIIRTLAPHVKKRSDWEWLQGNGLWPDGVVFENGSNGKSNKKLILEQ